MKVCRGCSLELSEAEFPRHKGGAGGLNSRCRACKTQEMRERRLKNPDLEKSRRRDHYLQNKERVLAQATIYRAAHKDEERVNRRAHYLRNKEKNYLVTKAYREANPALYAEAFARRRAAKRQAIPPWANMDIIRSKYDLAARLSRETGVPHEVDHIIPLQAKTVCGLHWEGNLEVVTRDENRSKLHFRWPDMP